MLMAHPTVLRDLLDEYEQLLILRAHDDTEEVRRRLDDVAYTLCVSTGTREVEAARETARRQLREAGEAERAESGAAAEDEDEDRKEPGRR